MLVTVTWDEDRFTAAGLIFSRSGNTAIFYTPLKPDAIRVGLIGEELQFLPRRSSGHKRVLVALGENLA